MHVLWMKAGMGKAVVKFSSAEEQLVEMYGIWKAEMMINACYIYTYLHSCRMEEEDRNGC